METGNEKQNVNIAEILRYAPKGLKLFSPLFGEVKFKEIDVDNWVVVEDKYNNHRWFYEYGTYFPSDNDNYPEGECLLFPSASHRCWNNWNSILFQKGDIVKDKIGVYIYCNPDYRRSDGHTAHMGGAHKYASPEEAKEFFEELEKNGYIWNGKMVVEKEDKQKFYVGDDALEKHCEQNSTLSDEDKMMLNELIIGFYAYKDLYPNFWKLRTDEIIEWLKKKKDEHTTDN